MFIATHITNKRTKPNPNPQTCNLVNKVGESNLQISVVIHCDSAWSDHVRSGQFYSITTGKITTLNFRFVSSIRPE